MLFPHLSSPPQMSITLESENCSFADSRSHPIKRHFLLSKKIRTSPSRTLEDILENDIDNLPQIQTKEDPNIFKEISQPNPLTKDFTQFNFGPRFDANGAVIPHSIVGKVDSFMNLHHKFSNSHYRQESKDGKSMNLEPRKTGLRSKASILLPDENVANVEKRSTLVKSSGQAKKPQKIKLSKMDLLADLNLSIERHKKANHEEEETIKKLETSDKLFLTKQTRILNLFDKYERKWRGQYNLTERKLQRNPQDSVVKNAELYRPRQEAAEAFQQSQSDYEKYGDRVWYMTLRLYGFDPNNVRKILYINDLPEGFKKAIVEKRSSIIEKIRKPNEEYVDSDHLYKTFTSKDYLKQKIEKNNKTLRVLAGNFKENFENFQIKGISKFELEKDSLLKEPVDIEKQVFTKVPLDEILDEVDEINYDPRSLSKAGALMNPKVQLKN